MENLIKIRARMTDGSEKKFRTTNFTVKPFRNVEELFLILGSGRTISCKSIKVEQKELQLVNAGLNADGSAGTGTSCFSN